MSNIEVKSPMKAKLRDVIVLSQKNRQPDDNPGAKLSLEATFANKVLDFFDPHLRTFLFEKATAEKKRQAELDGVEPVSDLASISAAGIKLGWFPWHQEFSGCTFTIDFGTGGKSNIVVKDALICGWKLQGKEGGAVVARFVVESNDVNESTFGKLAKLKSREISILVDPPAVDPQQQIPDAPPVKPAAKPAAERKPGAAERSAAARLGGKEEPKTPHKGEERKPRTERGKAQTKAALEAAKKEAAGEAKESKAAEQAAAATEAFTAGKAAEMKRDSKDGAGAPTLQ